MPKTQAKSQQQKSTKIRVRKSFADNQPLVDLPNLIEHQQRSFQWLVDEGLKDIFQEVNPIDDYTGGKLSLRFLDYKFGEPKQSEHDARENNVSFEVPLHAVVELTNKVTGEVKQGEIYIGEFPWMTTRGSFIINGAERVVVSQLIRSPGVFFTNSQGPESMLYGAKMIPARGSWIEIETNKDGAIYVKIDRKRKIAATTFLRALGYATNKSIEEALAHVNEGGKINHVEATLAKDPSTNQSEALIEVYRRLRPGDLATVENAKAQLENTFYNHKKFDLSKVGRYKFNQRLNLDVENTPENRILRLEDIVAIIAEVIRMNNTQEPADDIDALSNRRVKLVGELVQRQFRIGMLRMERNAKDRMSISDVETVTPTQLINGRPVVASVREFFASSQLSQFMDQINPLAELGHKRRLSSMGPGGLSRERAGFEVRDVHDTHYGRVCTVETPEGANIGLVLNMASYTRVNDYGFLETPYRKVINAVAPKDSAGHIASVDLEDEKGKVVVKAGKQIAAADAKKLSNLKVATIPVKAKVTEEVIYMDADAENKAIIAGAGNKLDENGYFVEERVSVRKANGAGEADANLVNYMDAAKDQIIGTAAALIPFAEKNYVYRSLMGANQQRQAVPLITPKAPLVGTGFEKVVALNSGQLIVAEGSGEVIEADADHVVVKYKNGNTTYHPQHFLRSNQGTSINQKVAVRKGDKLSKGDIIIEGMSVEGGELALGKDLLTAFMSWGGYNFEDAIIISKRLVQDDELTSIHIVDFMVEMRETKLGPEIITRDIPNVSEDSLRHLDDEGVVRIGAQVHAGDVLVGKITPKGEQELSSEERLLRAIFGEKAKDVRDTSQRMPNGKHGKVVGVKVFTKEDGHELKAGVIKQVQIFVAQMRKIAVGDKLGGRYGNKGVIARVLPEEDMPFMEDGTPVDLILNPLGIPSRMNIGQLFENHLGMAARALGYHVESRPFNGVTIDQIKGELKKAGLEEDGKVQLIDGRTGEQFKERTTVGMMHMIKLDHMIADKMHARSIGPYTMVTQQPLGGKAQNGGQRFGEMEVWALEAYGAANTLQEMLTIKSDDVYGRSKAYESIIKQETIVGPKVPESFNVLVKELQGLGLKIELRDSETDSEVDADDLLGEVAEQQSKDQSEIEVPEEAKTPIDVTEDTISDEFVSEEEGSEDVQNQQEEEGEGNV